MRRITRSRLLIGLASVLFVSVPGQSQTLSGLPGLKREPAEQEAPAAPAPEEILEISDIHARAFMLETRLRAIRSEARPRSQVVRVERELGELRETYERDRESLTVAAGDVSTTGQLEVREQVWTSMLEATAGWENVLSRRVQELQKLASELRTATDLWTRTRDAARDEALTPVQVDRVKSTLTAIAEAEREVVARRDHVWQLADQALKLQLAARDALDGLDEIRQQQRIERTETNAPPLWRAFAGDAEQGGLVAQARAAQQDHAAKLKSAIMQYAPRLYWHGVILIGLVAVFAWIRRRSQAWDKDDPALAAPLRIFARPIASATMVALVLSWVLYPLAPSSLFAITGLLALASTLTIVPALLPAGLRAHSYLLGGLYFATQLVTMAGTDGAFERVLVLAIGLLGAAILGHVWWLVRHGHFSALLSRWRAAIAFCLGAGVLVLAVAIGVNVVGKSHLGTFLTVATIRSAFLAVFLFLGGRVLGGVWVVFMRSSFARQLRSVQFHGDPLRERGLQWIRVGMVILWITAMLRLFELGRPLLDVVERTLSAPIEIRKLHLSLGMLVSFAGVLWAAGLISRFIRFFLDEDVLPRLSLARGVPRAVSLSLHYLLLLIGFIAALAAAGVEFSQFTILGGAFGIGLAFGMQNIVNNFVSGLILLYERPIQVGDSIEMGPITGNVERIGIRSSTVRTWDGAEIIIPNADLIAKDVTNWTLSDRLRRIHVTVGVAYGSDPTTVIRLLEELGARNEEILRSPPPSAIFVEFGESALKFTLRVWTSRFEDWLRIQSDLHVEVSQALAAAGIEIPFPQRDVHLRSASPALRGPTADAPGESA